MIKKLYEKLLSLFIKPKVKQKKIKLPLTRKEIEELESIGNEVYDYVKDEKLKNLYTNYFNNNITVSTYSSTDPSVYSMCLRAVLARDLDRSRSIYLKYIYNR